MAQLRRSLTVAAAPERVAGYLGDLRTSTEWDPHTVACRRLDDGPVRVGSRYAHTRQYAGHEVTLELEVVAYDPGSQICWAGGNEFADGREEFSFRPADDGGTVVEHGVEVTLHGVARVGTPMLPTVMERIADDGTDQLLTRLRELG